MELSARVEYAILALMEMANRYATKEPLKVNEITARQPIPDRYLEQILTDLRRDGIVQSQRGAKGGYSLAREPWQITLLEIAASVEGDRRPEAAAHHQETVEKDLVKTVWKQAKTEAQTILHRYTLQDLCQRRDQLRQASPMYHI